jgi:hypothetical protein
MMDAVKPHLVIISDEHGQSPTDRRFRENPIGLNITTFSEADRKHTKYISTKFEGRVKFTISQSGKEKIHQYTNYWEK